MGRKVKKRVAKPAAFSADRLAGLSPLLPVLGVAGFLLVVVGGLEALRSHVLSAPEYNPPLKLELEYPPGAEWLEQENWLPRITGSIELPDAKLMDVDLLDHVAERVRSSGWVRQVDRVTRDRDGTIRVCCQYRRPIAMLLTNRGKYIPIDREGVRLPEEYDRVDGDSGWMRILGVQSDPPAVGCAYGEGDRADEDAVAAVHLAALLFSQDEVSARISGIDVTNYNGREDKRKTHIRLWTRDGRPINWGSAPGNEIEEPDVEDKLRNLVLWLKRGSPQAYADLSIYRSGIVAPVGK